jgi:PEP-CTERM motif
MLRTLLVVALIVAIAPVGSAQFLENGSFNNYNSTYSTDDIPHWTVDSDEPFSDQAGIYFTLSEIHAIDGAMVLLTNAPNGGVFGLTDVTKLISDPFLVTADRKWIEFHYVYVTGQSAAEAAAGQTDPFEVALVNTGTGLPVYLETVATAADDLVHSTVDYGPLPGDNNRQTAGGWIHHKFSLLPYNGQTVNLVFTISDTPTSMVNSGVVLDNIRQTPEPGTFLLFGLGLAGVGLAVRARRRRRAA